MDQITAEAAQDQIKNAGGDPEKVRAVCENLLIVQISDAATLLYLIAQYAGALESLNCFGLALAEYRRLEELHKNDRGPIEHDEVIAILAQGRMLWRMKIEAAAIGLLDNLYERVEIGGAASVEIRDFVKQEIPKAISDL